MLTKDRNKYEFNELITFIQYDLPGLQAGKYKLDINQEIENETISAEYNLAVTTDRFSLVNSQKTIYSVFPAENASGKYNGVLPSVVLTKTSLPWCRSPYKEHHNFTSTENHIKDDIPTWLTIFLLDEEDIVKYETDFPEFKLEPELETIKDLYTDTERFSSYPDGANPEPGESPEDKIQTICIPVPLFKEIAPTLEDLKYMAHVRRVSLVNKATMPGISDIGEPEGSFSVVFGNRLPGSNRKTYAYLVSLERMEDFLPKEAGSDLDELKSVKLAVLKHWTFYSTDDNDFVADRLMALNIENNANLRMGVYENMIPEVSDALKMGFIPLNHHLRSASIQNGQFTGEKTVSWYRGPLTPYRVDDHRVNTPVSSADQTALFDPLSGMLDTSYSCAWTLGRQMALQDKKFSTNLYNWKNNLRSNVYSNSEREYVFGKLFPGANSTFGNNDSTNEFVKQAISSLKK